MTEKYELVTSMKEITDFLIKEKPKGSIAKLKDIVGEDLVGEILEILQGELIYIPSKASLSRAALVIEILKIKKFQKKDISEFNYRIKEVRRIYDIKKGKILEIMKTGKYIS